MDTLEKNAEALLNVGGVELLLERCLMHRKLKCFECVFHALQQLAIEKERAVKANMEDRILGIMRDGEFTRKQAEWLAERI